MLKSMASWQKYGAEKPHKKLDVKHPIYFIDKIDLICYNYTIKTGKKNICFINGTKKSKCWIKYVKYLIQNNEALLNFC